MKLKILTLMTTLLMVFALIQGLSGTIGAQQNSTPAAQDKAPPVQSAHPAGPAQAIPAQSALPPGPGQATTIRVCSGCHAVTVITSLRKSADDWAGSVDQMRSRGANGTDEEFDQISAYLAANFGPALRRRLAVRGIYARACGLVAGLVPAGRGFARDPSARELPGPRRCRGPASRARRVRAGSGFIINGTWAG